jgi:hypothetical protein
MALLVFYTRCALFETWAGGALVSFSHDFVVRTYVRVYAWHTHALAPFKTAKRVKQVEEKKRRRLNLPEIVMQMIQKVERYSNVARVCVAP